MKRIRLFLLAIMIITLCTGCTVEYNINISKEDIDETIIVNDYITYSRTENDILSHYNMWYPVFVNYVSDGETIELEDFSQKANGVEYYDKNITEIYNGYQYSYKYTYDIEDYYDSYALASTFVEPNVYLSNDSLILKTSKQNLLCNYDYFDEVKVNVTVDPKVYNLNYTNTSDIKNNTYTWTLDRSNCNDSQIILTLDIIESNNYNDDNKKKDNDTSKENDYTIYIFFGILIIIILLVSIAFKKLKEKNSKENEDD